MAFRYQKLILNFRPGCSRFRLLLDTGKAQSAVGAGAVQVANLTSSQSHGNEIQRAKPWPYETRRYNQYWQFIDHTRKRFNDNSKVILVDGNVATGKSEFAEKLATEFDMKYFPDPLDSMIYLSDSGIDYRDLNERLPPGARSLDIATFHMQDVHPTTLKTIGRTQLAIYRHRFLNYVNALEHLLNTGQGVVIERGPWSDLAFADTLRKLGYMTGNGYRYYQQWRDNTICELWKPHLVLYLDAPVSDVRQRINTRGRPSEVKGKVVTDKYLQTVEDAYKKMVLPNYSKYSMVLKYDVADLPDWEIIVEELESLDLDTQTLENEERFQDWMKTREDDWNHYRCLMSSKWQIENLFQMPAPWDAPEMMVSGEDLKEFILLVDSIPDLKFAAGYNPEKANVLLKF
ncbi:NADH dehydrogenase [ubiquinone] 1 alpha subcomplex subunit 10, mitochondrial-like [Haliotis cracherodii]|uniref:NADH dehydrogenase [ubiquinone] 1 alpha subcomplex subunit 10, mitochondrial-like n=1 Tax=Haliotis cracherodii TaxID=6455 RepID=UPI0039EA9F37